MWLAIPMFDLDIWNSNHYIARIFVAQVRGEGSSAGLFWGDRSGDVLIVGGA